MSKSVPLYVAIAGVAIYGLVLVVAGLWLGRTVFEVLGFGLDDGKISPIQEPYLRLVFAVLGAVIAGWMAALAFMMRRFGPAATPVVVVSVVVWFVLDTGISLALGFVGHAAFNVAFLALLGPALWLAGAGADRQIS